MFPFAIHVGLTVGNRPPANPQLLRRSYLALALTNLPPLQRQAKANHGISKPKVVTRRLVRAHYFLTMLQTHIQRIGIWLVHKLSCGPIFPILLGCLLFPLTHGNRQTLEVWHDEIWGFPRYLLRRFLINNTFRYVDRSCPVPNSI